MIKLPENIKNDMNLYRAGATHNVPHSFIDFHCIAANEDMWKQDWKILEDHGLIHDGWCDGMKNKQLVVAYKENDVWKTGTVMWHTSGAWFIKGAGWSRFREMIE